MRTCTVSLLASAWVPPSVDRLGLPVAPAGSGPFADAFRGEHVDGRGTANPAMVQAFRRYAGRREPELDKSRGEDAQQLRVDPHIDGVGVVGRPCRELATLGAVQVNELPADHCPAGVQPLVDVEQAMSRRCLLRRDRGKCDHDFLLLAAPAISRSRSSALRSSRGSRCSERSAARSSCESG